MQNKLNKRGLVGIISIVVFIATAIASLAIVWASISSTANQLSPALSCAEMQTSPPISLESACISSNQIELNLKRNSDVHVSNAKIVLQNSDISKANTEFSCGDSCSSCILPQFSGDSEIFSAFVSENTFTSATLSLDGCTLTSIDIVPCN